MSPAGSRSLLLAKLAGTARHAGERERERASERASGRTCTPLAGVKKLVSLLIGQPAGHQLARLAKDDDDDALLAASSQKRYQHQQAATKLHLLARSRFHFSLSLSLSHVQQARGFRLLLRPANGGRERQRQLALVWPSLCKLALVLVRVRVRVRVHSATGGAKAATCASILFLGLEIKQEE